MNETFKAYAKGQGVKLYQVAEKLGLRPPEFSVQYMRHELTKSETTKLKAIVREIKREREGER